jgi:hypothetical protein
LDAAKKAEARRRIARAYSVPKGKKKLVVVTVVVAIQSREELDRLTDGFDRVLARSYPKAYREGRAPWRIMTVPGGKGDRKQWAALLAD